MFDDRPHEVVGEWQKKEKSQAHEWEWVKILENQSGQDYFQDPLNIAWNRCSCRSDAGLPSWDPMGKLKVALVPGRK